MELHVWGHYGVYGSMGTLRCVWKYGDMTVWVWKYQGMTVWKYGCVCVQECEMLRVESEDAVKQSRITERENKRLKLLTSDLGRQVQVLLKECEEARGGVVSSSHDQSHDISSHDISSSSQVISAHLVTFK